MSSNDYLEYYRERARRERELAAAARHPKAAAAHAALADVYEALVANDQRPTARILRPDFQKRAIVGCDESARLGAVESEV
jgi:adenine-specific DNA methylase